MAKGHNTVNFERKKEKEIMINLIEMNRFEQVAKFNTDISKKKPLFFWNKNKNKNIWN
jgi:hypothetical protein